MAGPPAADAMPAVAPAAQRLVLPLDHGPRAQSTPWLNQQRSKAGRIRLILDNDSSGHIFVARATKIVT
jgi:hypothetical protein